jgi:uncharacterized protein YutE (UPF0331/DUF86 family)
MTLDIASIQIKLDLIADYLDELKTLAAFRLDEILDDMFKYRTAERLLELIIQASLDVNRHLLKEIYQLEPNANAEVFLKSIEVGILPKQIGAKLSEAAKFRNVLAHLYDKIDPQKVVENISSILQDYPIYIDCLNSYLESLEVNNDE